MDIHHFTHVDDEEYYEVLDVSFEIAHYIKYTFIVTLLKR